MGQLLSATKEIPTLDIVPQLGLFNKGILTLTKVADIIAEQLKLHPSYAHGDAELRQIVDNLQSLLGFEGSDEQLADFYTNIEWLKDWGDHGDRLLVIDDENDPYMLERL